MQSPLEQTEVRPLEHMNSVIVLSVWIAALLLLPFAAFRRKRSGREKETLYVDRIPKHSGPDPFESDLEKIDIINIENNDLDLYLPKRGT